MDINYKLIIAKNIVELRKSLSITQAELAESINYSDKAVSKWERGESVPDIMIMKRLADFFGVSIDYFFEEVHTSDSVTKSVPWQKKKKHFIITALSCALVFFIATFLFVILNLTTDIPHLWLAFIYCVPVCSILLIIFNTLWGRGYWNYIFISTLVWGLLTSIYLTIGDYGNWLIFIIGAPAQVIIIMWSFFKAKFLIKIKKKPEDKK